MQALYNDEVDPIPFLRVYIHLIYFQLAQHQRLLMILPTLLLVLFLLHSSLDPLKSLLQYQLVVEVTLVAGEVEEISKDLGCYR